MPEPIFTSPALAAERLAWAVRHIERFERWADAFLDTEPYSVERNTEAEALRAERGAGSMRELREVVARERNDVEAARVA